MTNAQVQQATASHAACFRVVIDPSGIVSFRVDGRGCGDHGGCGDPRVNVSMPLGLKAPMHIIR